MRFASMVALAPVLLAAGCVMPRPWRYQAYANSCTTVTDRPEQASRLFITLRLPDCTNGHVELTRYRSDAPHYASEYQGRILLHEEAKWMDALRDRRGGSAPIIFIHGFNNSNEEALTRAKKIADAVHGTHEVVAITWPSYAHKTAYYWDEANAEWALAPSSAIVSKIVESVPHSFIVAHSMGNRLALHAVADLASRHLLSKVDRLIMAAPDVDRGALAASWGSRGPLFPVTMYVSRKDQALSVSWRGHAYPRAGDFSWWVSGQQPVYAFAWLPNLEVIDTTNIDRSPVGHSAFIDTTAGRADLCRVIRGYEPRHRALRSLLLPADQSDYFELSGQLLNDGCDQP